MSWQGVPQGFVLRLLLLIYINDFFRYFFLFLFGLLAAADVWTRDNMAAPQQPASVCGALHDRCRLSEQDEG